MFLLSCGSFLGSKAEIDTDVFGEFSSIFIASDSTELGKYQPKMIRLSNSTFKTIIIIVYDSFFRKSISIVYCLSLLNQQLTKPVSMGWWRPTELDK